MKQIYQIIGLIIIGVAIFFVGQYSVPEQGVDYLEEFKQVKQEYKTLDSLHSLTQDSLQNFIVLFNDSKSKGDDMNDAFLEDDEKKKSEYEKINYPDMSGDESYNRLKSRLSERIDNSND